MVKKIVLAVVGALLVSGLVFGGLMLFREKLDYVGASSHVDDILATEQVITEFLGDGVGETTDETTLSVARFEQAAERTAEHFRTLGASSAMKNKEVKAQYDALTGMIGRLEETKATARWLISFIDGGYEEADLRVLAEAPNEYVAAMAADMAEYLGKVAKFQEKYAAGKADSYNVMTEEYGVILTEGEALKVKYTGATMEDVVGMSGDDVRNWFDELRQLKSILEEKK